ncbi:hypothetical protein Gogos_006136 [Gossypium gossypioides]|uniref:Uncharacterized protein n=1 Tax=Gossypium gossypioides TaxID=34282 RepID=A0A7J9C4N6_GOSGO|nr:hypothetical protein [Gossypium gossypioides]
MLKFYLNKWNHSLSYGGIPTALEDIQLLLDQRLEAHDPWHLLSEEERHWQIRVEREQWGLLNPSTMGGEAGPSTVPMQSPALTEQAMMPTPQPLQIMPNVYPNSYVYPNPYMYPFFTPMSGWNVRPSASHFPMAPSQLMIYRPLSQERPHEAPSGSSTHFQSPSPYGIQAGYAHCRG